MSAAARPRVLVASPSAPVRTLIALVLRRHGYGVVLAATAYQAYHAALVHVPALLVLSPQLPDADAATLLRVLHDHPALHGLRVLLLGEPAALDPALHGVLAASLPLPFERDQLLGAVYMALGAPATAQPHVVVVVAGGAVQAVTGAGLPPETAVVVVDHDARQGGAAGWVSCRPLLAGLAPELHGPVHAALRARRATD